MALADYIGNLLFLHTFDTTLDADVTNGLTFTQGNPGALSDPDVSGGFAVFNDDAGLSLTPTSGAIADSIGTGGFTLVVRGRVAAGNGSLAALAVFDDGNQTQGLGMTIESPVGRTLQGGRVDIFSLGVPMDGVSNPNGQYIEDNDFIAIVRRPDNNTENEATFFFDADATGGLTDVTEADNIDSGTVSPATNAYIGCHPDGGGAFTGRIYAIALFDTEISDGDAADATLWTQAALRSAYVGAGGGPSAGATVIPRYYQMLLGGR